MIDAMPQRCLTLEDAAAYCGLNKSGFRDWVKRGLLPGPIKGTKRYDKCAIDQALDRLSEIDHPIAPQSEASGAYDQWKADRGTINENLP